MFQVVAQALARAKPKQFQGNPGTYHAALSEWNTTVTIVAKTLAEQCPNEFNREQFLKETTYYNADNAW